jgi:hypothetical protein
LSYLSTLVQKLNRPVAEAVAGLARINDLVRKAWAVPTHGHELGYAICNHLRTSGALDLLIENCVHTETRLQFSSARLLEQILTTENRAHVVQQGLQKVVHVACKCTKHSATTENSRVGTGILEHLFKHSESTCSEVSQFFLDLGLSYSIFARFKVEILRFCTDVI